MMIREDNNWFYYKKILSWTIYGITAVIGVFTIYFIVEYFFEKTFESRGVQYVTYQGGYTSEPGSDPGPVDKSKWQKKSVDRSWNVPVFNQGVIHPLVAVTIASIIVIAIIGGIIVFRSQTKNPHR